MDILHFWHCLANFGYTVPNPIRRRITIARALTYVIAPKIDIPMFKVKYLAMHKDALRPSRRFISS